MAYTPINWQTGDTITADKLNKMDNGWGVQETQLFSETVTTTVDQADPNDPPGANLAYSQLIDADTIAVTYDGTEYTCPSIGAGEYGAPFNGGNTDFSEFPFNLYTISGLPAFISTQTAGEHTIAVTTLTLQTSVDFDKARGYGYVTGSPTELFSETVTTANNNGVNVANLSYSQRIDADTITVTFNGTEYTCPRINFGEAYAYGGFKNGPDFTKCPFFIWSDSQVNQLITQTAGEYTIAVTASVTSMQTSSDFEAAVDARISSAISSAPMRCVGGTTYRKEIENAIAAGKLVYFWTSNHGCFFITKVGRPFTIFPESSEVTATHNSLGQLIITES